MMQFDKVRVQSFCNDLTAGQWDKVGAFLTELLDKTPCATLDAVDLGGNAPLLMWINAMLYSGLYKSSEKGRFFFMKLVRDIWSTASDQERWAVLCCVACLYGKRPGDLDSSEECTTYFHALADMMHIAQGEVMRVVVNHRTNSSLCGNYSFVPQ